MVYIFKMNHTTGSKISWMLPQNTSSSFMHGSALWRAKRKCKSYRFYFMDDEILFIFFFSISLALKEGRSLI